MAVAARPSGDSLTAQNILTFINAQSIFERYCTNYHGQSESFSSDLREDKIPSCKIAELNVGWRYKDFTTGDCYDCFGYVQAKWPHLSFYEVLQVIDSDFNLKLNTIDTNVQKLIKNHLESDDIPITDNRTYATKSVKIDCIYREFNKLDLDYWYNTYKITKEDLEFFNVKPLLRYYTNNIQTNCVSNNPSYCYHVNDRVKIYNPLSEDKAFKFRCNTTAYDIQGFEYLPQYTELILITSSYKDIITLRKAGFYAIAFNSEHQMPSHFLISNLKRRSKYIMTLLDNDFDKEKNWGQEAAEKMNLQYEIDGNLKIPSLYKSSDPSDFIENHKQDYHKLSQILTIQIQLNIENLRFSKATSRV